MINVTHRIEISLVLAALLPGLLPSGSNAQRGGPESIADVVADRDADRLPDRVGDTVTVAGVLVTDPYIGAPAVQRRAYVQDSTGGIRIQAYDRETLAPFAKGDSVRVVGVVAHYRAMTVIEPLDVTRRGRGSIPEPRTVAVSDLLGEELQGQLVRVVGELTVDRAPDIRDATGAIRIFAANRFFEDRAFTERLYSGEPAEVVGIAEQMDDRPPFDRGYRLLLVDPAELIVHARTTPFLPLVAVAAVLAFATIGLGYQYRRAQRRAARISALLERAQRSEAALRDREHRLETVVETTNDVIWELDITSREVWRSAGIDRLSQRKAPEDGDPSGFLLQHVHPDDRDRVRAGVQRMIDGETDDWSDEFRFGGSGNEWLWIEDRARLVRDEMGHPVRIIGALVDVTRRKQAEEERERLNDQMHQAQRLESLGVLAAGIAHDFNNILAGVMGNAELIRVELPQEGKATRFATAIDRAAQRGTQLADQMLTYAGDVHTTVEPVDLNEVARETASLLGSVIPKSTRLVLDLEEDVPNIEGDPAKIQQTVMNLITNGSEALEGRVGTVTVETGSGPWCGDDRSHAAAFPEVLAERYVWIRVVDTGSGMDTITRNRIFDPFFTTKFEGRGLGLSATLGILRGHNGILTLDTAPGSGSTFTIYLPASESGDREVAAKPEPESTEWKGTGTALVVDDDKMVHEVLQAMLEHAGFRVLSAWNGGDGVRLFEQQNEDIDLVVLDQTMPELSGTEALRKIRTIDPKMRVLMVSGRPSESIQQGIEGDRVSFLSKPFRRAELHARLKALCEEPRTEPTE